MLACALGLSMFCPVRVRGDNLTLAWDRNGDNYAAGYKIYWGLQHAAYMASDDAGTNLSATVAGLIPGAVYYFAVKAYDAYGDESGFSNEVTNRLPILPRIVGQPSSQSDVAGAPASLAVLVWGDPPLSYRWSHGREPIADATNSLLSWPQIQDGTAGSYTVIVSNLWGSITSSVAVMTVLDPPRITLQPQAQTVFATAAASFSAAVTGTAPLSFQWYLRHDGPGGSDQPHPGLDQCGGRQCGRLLHLGGQRRRRGLQRRRRVDGSSQHQCDGKRGRRV